MLGRGEVAQKFSLTPLESRDPTMNLVLHSPGVIPDPGASTFFRILQMVRVSFGGAVGPLLPAPGATQELPRDK